MSRTPGWYRVVTRVPAMVHAMQTKAVPCAFLVLTLLLARALETTASKEEPLQLQQQRQQASLSDALGLAGVHDPHHGRSEHACAATSEGAPTGAQTCTVTQLENQQALAELGAAGVLQPQQPFAVPFGSGAAARRLQQAGTTTLQPNSAPTRCLDTSSNYTNYRQLDLALSCTGTIHQRLFLPVAGSDLTMKLPGGTNKCLDVAMAGTTSGTNVGVSG
jgi:hypothetical protein